MTIAGEPHPSRNTTGRVDDEFRSPMGAVSPDSPLHYRSLGRRHRGALVYPLRCCLGV